MGAYQNGKRAWYKHKLGLGPGAHGVAAPGLLGSGGKRALTPVVLAKLGPRLI